MKKSVTMLGIGLLVVAVGVLSFGATTILSSVIAIAEDDGMPTTATTVEPVINPAASPQYDSPDYGFTYLTYRVKRGDNLTDIARRHSSDMYKIGVEEMVTLNGIKNPNRILAGQKLRLPVYYAKEVQAVVPAMRQAAIEAAVAPKEARLAEIKQNQWIAVGVMIVAAIIFVALGIHAAIYAQKILNMESNEKHAKTEPEKFLSYPDEIRAKLQQCTGRDILSILEAELVEIPRGPGSAATNKVKVKNITDLMKKYPELLPMQPELWSAHLAEKMNRVAPAQETA